jgi:hypothetical protein
MFKQNHSNENDAIQMIDISPFLIAMAAKAMDPP